MILTMITLTPVVECERIHIYKFASSRSSLGGKGFHKQTNKTEAEKNKQTKQNKIEHK